MALTRIQTDSLGGSTVIANNIANSAITLGKVDTATQQLFGSRNRIINGNMQINQRNAANTTATGYTLDRWKYTASNTSTGEVTYDTSGTLGKSVGFLKFATGGSSYTIGTSELFTISQPIEGFNISDLQWGTSYASSITLSFWIRTYNSTSGNGNYTGAIQNNDKTWSYVFTFNVTSATVWQYVTITIPGPTFGTWTKDNTAGMHVVFNLGCGSTYITSSNNAWVSGNYISTSAVSVQDIASKVFGNFHITQVQLEKGSTASPFEWRPYNIEMLMCQRYYEQYVVSTSNWADVAIPYNGSTTNQWLNWRFQVTKRATPTLVNASVTTISSYSTIISTGLSPYGVSWNGTAGFYITSYAGPSYLAVSAEL